MYQIEIMDAENNKIGELDPVSVFFDKNFMNVGTASFSVDRAPFDIKLGKSVLNPNLTEEVTQTWRRVYIYSLVEGGANLVWEGWIISMNDNKTTLKFLCVDFWGWIGRKKLETNTQYDEDQICEILTTEWETINALKYTGFEIDCSIIKTISPEIKSGQEFKQLLDEIIDFGFEVEAIFPKITVKETVGIDQSTNEKILTYSFDNRDTSTISSVGNSKIDGAGKYNRLIAKGKNSSEVIIGTAAADEELLTATKSFEKYDDTTGDLTELATKYLEFINSDKLSFTVTPKPSEFLVGSLNVGDTIIVQIETEDSLFDVDDSFRIIGFKASNDGYITELNLSQYRPFDKPAANILDRLKRLEQTI